MSEEEFLKEAAGDLTVELAQMHATLFNLIIGLHHSKLSSEQAAMVDAAWAELEQSQKRFFAKYVDMIGGANPENN
jgi:hypothetical protein